MPSNSPLAMCSFFFISLKASRAFSLHRSAYGMPPICMTMCDSMGGESSSS
ncbi:unnamed protein product [Chondrus crispus]|uniref:Uncharacterized protein n=1 Tax=Chondrus crispus TaxID=2769 RepID=R7QL91_CHOCR|nr:unnamed protein product [Chondrus crispus]CDF39282.1 unnamed protein product [Chondrus crispus]|eukprot:XP_005719193.1 unnamed protein product [Chondrus crispus]